MVSFTLDAVKFLLIYRYLQNTYWFKREELYCSAHFTIGGSGIALRSKNGQTRRSLTQI